MGQFSWLDCKTQEQVLDDVCRDVYVLVPKEFGGGHIKETCYDGYGRFGGRDVYALVAQWNKPESCIGDGANGAVAIIKAEEELKKAFPNGYIVIPSSIHEMLVMPCDAIEEDKMNDLVGDVNEHALSPEERLSNNVYKFVERRTK